MAWLGRIWRSLALPVAILVLAAALLLSGLRLALPQADGLKQEIAAELSRYLDVRVEIDDVRLSMYRLQPKLVLSDTKLFDRLNGEPLLNLRELRIDLDLFSTLMTLAPRIEGVMLVGATLEVQRTAEGRLLIRGLDAIRPGDGRALAFFLREGRFELTDSLVYWTDAFSGDMTQRFDLRWLSLTNRGRSHLLSGEIRPDADSDGLLRLSAALQGPPQQIADWSGSVYLDWQGRDAAQLIASRLPEGLGISNDFGRLESWSQLDQGKLVESLNRFRIKGLQLRRPDSASSERLGDFIGLVRWQAETARRGSPGWRLQGLLQSAQRGDTSGAASIKDLKAGFQATAMGGSARIDLGHFALDLRPALVAPLQFDSLSGGIQWIKLPDGGWGLWSDALQAATADVRSLSRLALRIGEPEQSPFIDLHSRFAGGTAEAMESYLPVSVMDPMVVDWLNQAVIAGNLELGSLELTGRLANFPFDRGDGAFRLELQIRDGILDYVPKLKQPPHQPEMRSADDHLEELRWPRLEEADVALIFSGRSLDIELASGRILNTELTAGRARIADLWKPRVMDLRAAGRGPLEDGLRVLGDTPLSRQLGILPQILSTTGSGSLELALAIPLEKNREFGFSGNMTFEDAASLLIHPSATHQANAQSTGNAPRQIQLSDLQGQFHFDNSGLSAQDLRATWLGAPIQVEIQSLDTGSPEARTLITARSRSQVEQLASQLPSSLWSALSGSTDWQLQLRIHNAQIALDEPTLDWTLSSDLRGLAVEAPGLLAKAADQARDLMLSSQFKPRAPHAIKIDYGQIRGTLSQLDKGWNLAFNTPSQQGRLQWIQAAPRDQLLLDLARFDLKPALEKKEEAGAVKTQNPDPRQIPVIALNIEQLVFGDRQIGSLNLQTRPNPGGLDIQTLSLRGSNVRLDGSGNWLLMPDDSSQTQLNLQLDSPDLGALLDSLGFEKEFIDTPVRANGQLRWPGSPIAFKSTQAAGEIALETDGGSIAKIDAGVGRVLGILNISALTRRLNLDFSDVFKSGFSFDSVHGRLQLADARVQIKELEIAAPNAQIRIQGSTNLEARTYDQRVQVTPELGASIAVASGLAGGPLVGAAVYLADSLTGNQLNRLATQTYQITGAWDQPEITRIAPENGERSISDILSGVKAGTHTESQETKGSTQSNPFLDNP